MYIVLFCSEMSIDKRAVLAGPFCEWFSPFIPFIMSTAPSMSVLTVLSYVAVKVCMGGGGGFFFFFVLIFLNGILAGHLDQ
jgi:hypothetical protein